MLLCATAALYLITSFLFRSFAAHRAELAKDYARSGRAALQAGHPEQAIDALRVSLSYDPDDAANRLLYAGALAQAHHVEEATNYFLTLRDAQPADGYINLELARLTRGKGDASAAIEYYRASSMGNWSGDALTERRKVQLEFADYLIKTGDLRAARSEVLIAATNAPETADLEELFGDEFVKADAPTSALAFYRRAADLDPNRFSALFKGGSIAYQMGQYAEAADLLGRAERAANSEGERGPDVSQARSLAGNARRILSLSISPSVPPLRRIQHLNAALPIAKARLAACVAQITGSNPAQSLQLLQAQWQNAAKLMKRRLSPDDGADQDALTQLVFDTEIRTAEVCGAPAGDDALLLRLARAEHER